MYPVTGTSTCKGRNGRMLLSPPITSLCFISAAVVAVFSTLPGAFAQDTHIVFVYGTLKVGEMNHDVLTDPDNGMASLVGEAITTDKWPLVIWPSSSVPYMVDLKGEGYRVAGEVYTVDDKMFAKLDEVESVPESYYRKMVDVELLTGHHDDSDGPFKAWNYFAAQNSEELLQLPFISNYTAE
ncbi:gamma-glutamylaminecyclotransferase-like [Dermacentor andersoni]|uniref:gamma-glutamylaminecyclotransferase-like n=1 Tax=Dermacentor andersoni TaxID=34620 RepID=UPI002417F7F6|nr:gamma-glutamylaminecyclotransferase-like isoform X1 [Dermacentor andersoni]